MSEMTGEETQSILILASSPLPAVQHLLMSKMTGEETQPIPILASSPTRTCYDE